MSGLFNDAVANAEKAFASGKTKLLSFRKKQLHQLLECFDENQNAFSEALMHDLHRPRFEAFTAELMMVRNEIALALDNIDLWTKTESVSKGVLQLFCKLQIRKEPYGVCLIMSAWNYPVALLLSPLVGAIAAGNCAIIKPSECAEATASLLLKVLPKYLDNDCYPVIVCDGPQSADLLKNHRFDMIFFTGGTSIGRLVMKAAAEYLTPVVLELGGKNPCYVDGSYDLKSAARRIVWGRYYNAGQVCLSPDYIMIDASLRDKFVAEVRSVLKKFYGENPQQSPDYGRIINKRQFARLKKLLDSQSGKIVIGGDVDESDRYIAPTVVVDIDLNSPYMQEEMFGPIMLIVTVSSLDEAISVINHKEKPLAVYMFSNNKAAMDKMLHSTASGDVTINDVFAHYISHNLPFGGVGSSGMGSYHGKASFEAFSHRRSCVIDGTPDAAQMIRYPPYSEQQLTAVRFLLEKKPKKEGIFANFSSLLLLSLIGVGFAYLVKILQ